LHPAAGAELHPSAFLGLDLHDAVAIETLKHATSWFFKHLRRAN
jgi:hypothetical protein